MKRFELIDFDAKFKEYLEDWLKHNRSKFEKVEEIEEVIPSLYEDWAKEQSQYFNGFSGQELIDLFIAYHDSNMDIPDVLFRTIIERKAETEQPVYGIFSKNVYPEKVQIMLINLLSCMESTLPLDNLLSILSQTTQESDLVETAAEAVYNMGDLIGEPALAAYDSAKSLVGKELILNAIIRYSKAPSLYSRISALFKETKNKAFVAALMGEYGDERCLPDLYEAEKANDINYVDYTEICNAIEQLGGQTQREREFDNDPFYELMKSGNY